MSDITTRLTPYLKGSSLQFVLSQIKSSMRQRKGRRWTVKDKSLALSLLHSSPQTYRLLYKIFALPSIQTLRRVVKSVAIYPGFNDQVISALGQKLSSAPATSKLVSVVFDEMSIKEGVTYDSGRDVVEGFAEGTERSKLLANHALVFMVRGLVEKWKLPVGYFLSSGPMKGSVMRDLLFTCLSKLMSIGLKVLVVITDQGSNNINMFNTLLKVSVQYPFFFYQGSKVHFMFDPPHLIKNIRNNFKKYGFTVNGKDIDWNHVKEFYERDSAMPIRLAPKLTDKHISLPPFTPLRVSLATQVLSHSVAAGMSVMAKWKIIPEAASHTAQFIEDFDQLFNVFNSQTLTSTAKMRHAISPNSVHVEFLKEKLEWIQGIKSKGTRTPGCLQGWRITISALLELWDVLRDTYALKFLLTNRLNQDCVENLFSVIRLKGAQRDNPDASQFRAALRQVMVDGVLSPIRGANCCEDVDEFLFKLGNDPTVPATVEPVETQQERVTSQLPSSVNSILQVCTITPHMTDSLSQPECNIITYIAGYIIRKINLLKDKVCYVCIQNLMGEINNNDPNQDFLREKMYAEAASGLIVPSSILTSVLENLEQEYRKVVEEVVAEPNVMARLISTMNKRIDLSSISCETCHVEMAVVQIMLKIRFHHTLKENNRRLNVDKSRKNRKTLKFSHL